MGFRKPDLAPSYHAIRHALTEIQSPHTDGFTGAYCKQELYQLKCWLNDEYKKLPTFLGEEVWEQERLVQLLKK
jgi:hypothetical protein